MKDLHNNITPAIALKLQTIATDTTTDGEDIAMANFESCEFIVATGTVTDGDYAVMIEEADDDGAGSPDTYAEVADADLIGTEAGASFDADDDDDKVSKIGYIGTKAWVRLAIVSTNTSSGAVIGAIAVRGHRTDMPDATQQP